MDTFHFATCRGLSPRVKLVQVSYLSSKRCTRHCILTFDYDGGNASLTVDHFNRLSQQNQHGKLIWIENDAPQVQDSTLYSPNYTCPNLGDIAYEVNASDYPDVTHSCCGFINGFIEKYTKNKYLLHSDITSSQPDDLRGQETVSRHSAQ
ncbi:hypothetical protein BDV41DRAFT_578969 [Aspergillus transmontanensis]|uniref:Uncharacterized protein n=1 Tax=Aspergillus transmontanensis TaxID=1034304 RepID=A0A5N6VRG5_9EURO|nr:hypothetical protein BDV41DRAFT_578969 [Aspergillus transmontanensis]